MLLDVHQAKQAAVFQAMGYKHALHCQFGFALRI
jgi:hypothetical protein